MKTAFVQTKTANVSLPAVLQIYAYLENFLFDGLGDRLDQIKTFNGKSKSCIYPNKMEKSGILTIKNLQ